MTLILCINESVQTRFFAELDIYISAIWHRKNWKLSRFVHPNMWYVCINNPKFPTAKINYSRKILQKQILQTINNYISKSYKRVFLQIYCGSGITIITITAYYYNITQLHLFSTRSILYGTVVHKYIKQRQPAPGCKKNGAVLVL